MDNMVRLIIEIPEELYENKKGYLTNMDAYMICKAVQNGILFDSVKAKIKRMEYHMIDCDVLVSQEEVLDILDNIDKNKE